MRARGIWVLGGIGLVGAVALVYALPLILVPEAGLDAERRLKAENDLRTTFVQAVGGAIVLVGTARTLHINREGQITERFTRAIDQLGQTGGEKLDVRLGGIYALERIARDSKSDRGPIVEVLTAFLREHTRSNFDSAESRTEEAPRLRADFQAVATILGRNRWSRHGVDLREVDLRAANLRYAHLEIANLTGANLERADLTGTYLQWANFTGAARLVNAILTGAHLEGANLTGTYLQRANLTGAHLEGADLTRAYLGWSDLTGAHLEGAELSGAHLEGAHLNGAHLEGAKGLTPEQVERVIGLTEAIGVPPGLLGT